MRLVRGFAPAVTAFAATFVAVFLMVTATACQPTATCRHHATSKATMLYTGGPPYYSKTVGEVRNDSKWSTTGYGTNTSPAYADCYGIDARSIATTSDSYCYHADFGVETTSSLGPCQTDRLKNGPTYVKNDLWNKFRWIDGIAGADSPTGVYTLHASIYDNKDMNDAILDCDYNVISGGSPYSGARDYNCTGQHFR